MAGWYAVFILLLAYILSFVDRIIISLLVIPIQSDLGISDTQMGLLMGLAFAIFYVAIGIPIAKLSDEKSRRIIISIGIFLWSLMTAACGLAKSFSHLFFARIGVGVGEEVDMDTLTYICPESRPPKRMSEVNFREFFQWLSASLKQVSMSSPDQQLLLPSTVGWEVVEV